MVVVISIALWAITVALGGGLAYVGYRQLQKQQRQHNAQLTQQLQKNSDDIRILFNSALHLGNHLKMLEQNYLALVADQQQSEQTAAAERPYLQADQLLSLGAAHDEVMASCGLSRAETELLQALAKHRQEKVLLE